MSLTPMFYVFVSQLKQMLEFHRTLAHHWASLGPQAGHMFLHLCHDDPYCSSLWAPPTTCLCTL